MGHAASPGTRPTTVADASALLHTAPPATAQHSFYSHYGRRLKTQQHVAFMSQTKRGDGLDKREWDHGPRKPESTLASMQPRLKMVCTKVMPLPQ